MDLLYFLQTIRMSAPERTNLFFIVVSESTILLAPLIAAVVYWCRDKKKGTYILCAFAMAFLCNELFKLTFCVYRPWVRDPRLIPAAEVVGNATNYSFPSSHSTAAASVLGTCILAFPKDRKLRIFACIFLPLVMFSRMYLGCHTLQDVLCGASIGLIMAFLFRPLLSENFNEERFTKLLLPVSIGITVLSIVYVMNKSYPLDYNADGKLLVDPENMWPDTVGAAGIVAAIGPGLFLERTKIHFRLPDSKRTAVWRAVLGSVIFGLLYAVILKKLFGGLPHTFIKFFRFYFSVLTACAFYPALFRKIRLIS